LVAQQLENKKLKEKIRTIVDLQIYIKKSKPRKTNILIKEEYSGEKNNSKGKKNKKKSREMVETVWEDHVIYDIDTSRISRDVPIVYDRKKKHYIDLINNKELSKKFNSKYRETKLRIYPFGIYNGNEEIFHGWDCTENQRRRKLFTIWDKKFIKGRYEDRVKASKI
jgi:hypothetical protein